VKLEPALTEPFTPPQPGNGSGLLASY